MRKSATTISLLAAAALAGGAAMAMNDTAATTGAGGFDTPGWTAAAGNPEGSDPRFEMIDAAIAALPPGTSRDDVRARLGAPDEERGTDWVYFAGTTLFGGEYVLLVVSFDGDAVTQVRRAESETYTGPAASAAQGG